MNRIERRVRNLINSYSTAFAGWWCHSGRYLGLARMVAGDKAGARPSRPRPAWPLPALARPAMPPVPPSPDRSLAIQALRRAAIEKVLDDERE